MQHKLSDTIYLQLQVAHTKYLMEHAYSSTLAPLDMYRFGKALILGSEKDWWLKFMGPLDHTIMYYQKELVYKLLWEHQEGLIDLNTMSCPLHTHQEYMDKINIISDLTDM